MTEKQKKGAKEKNTSEITLADFLGKKILDMSSENKTLTIFFSNGYNIVLTGDISIKKEKTK